MMQLRFRKMHGLGNDFVVVDLRGAGWFPAAADIRALADRRRGVGCDQVVLLTDGAAAADPLTMVIHNADGGRAGACGNAARCVAALLMAETGREQVSFAADAGRLTAWRLPDGGIAVDMGPARTAWQDIPIATAQDTLRVDLGLARLPPATLVSMGNPHAVLPMANVDELDLAEWGPVIEHHRLFPDRTNVEFIQILDRDCLRMRVWERGVGITLACGSGACASAVAAARLDLCGRAVTVIADGGPLGVRWRPEDDHVILSGPVAESFSGTVDLPALLADAARPQEAAA